MGVCQRIFIEDMGDRMQETDLRKMQLIQLEMLVELDRICRKYEIEYFIIAGTLLGAVRHGGFIPWDDDVDVAMKRSEYERFCEVCKKELADERFFLQNYHTDSEYRWGYAKLRKRNTEYIRKGQEMIKCMSGVSIDLFIIDYVPDNYVLRMAHHYIRRGCIKTLWSVIGATQEKNPLLRRLYRILRYVPKEFPNRVEELMVRCTNKKKRKYLCYTGFYRETYYTRQRKNRYDTGMKSEWFERRVEVEFEGKFFYTCAGYKEYLAYMYGDYMQIPKEAERENHPASSYTIN